MKTAFKTALKLNLLFVLFFLLNSCREPEAVAPTTKYPRDANGMFEAFWNGMNSRYSMWDHDSTSWDFAYLEYKPKVRSDMTDAELFELFSEMTALIKDGHFAFSYNDTISFSPRFMQLAAEGHEPNFLPSDLAYTAKFVQDTVSLPIGAGVYGRVKKTDLQYVRLNYFAFAAALVADPTRAEKARQFLLNPPSWSKGLILDLRNNPGGDAFDTGAFISLFTNSKINMGHSRQRIGEGRFDYGPWYPNVITGGEKVYTKPIVVLVDRFTVSMAELTTMALATLPNVTILGEKTFGAVSIVSNSNELNGGGFDLPRPTWTVTMASAAFRYIDGKLYDGIGFDPDVVLPFDQARYTRTLVDNQLEAAINKLK